MKHKLYLYITHSGDGVGVWAYKTMIEAGQALIDDFFNSTKHDNLRQPFYESRLLDHARMDTGLEVYVKDVCEYTAYLQELEYSSFSP